jgi:nucleoside-diphosphate-sugar epimerase
VRAFVTGGTGFVGSHLVELLLAGGHEVTCLARNPAKARALFDARLPGIVEGTLEDERALRGGMAGAEVVFHVAGAVAARSRADFFDRNEGATRRVLACAPPSVRRFVYVSSLAAAGPAPRGRQLLGGEPEHPVTHYGASKLAAERAVRESSVPWTIVRPPAVYGPRDAEFLRVFKLAARGLVPVFGDGSQELSFVYVEDLARALVTAARAPEAESGIYYPGHPEVVRSRAFVTAVGRAVRPHGPAPVVIPIPGLVARGALWVIGTAAALLGRTTLLTADKANELLADAWTCSPEAFTRDTGWTANFPLSVGLAKTAAWYREQGWL